MGSKSSGSMTSKGKGAGSKRKVIMEQGAENSGYHIQKCRIILGILLSLASLSYFS